MQLNKNEGEKPTLKNKLKWNPTTPKIISSGSKAQQFAIHS